MKSKFKDWKKLMIEFGNTTNGRFFYFKTTPSIGYGADHLTAEVIFPNNVKQFLHQSGISSGVDIDLSFLFLEFELKGAIKDLVIYREKSFLDRLLSGISANIIQEIKILIDKIKIICKDNAFAKNCF